MLSDVSTANLELLLEEVESGDLSVPLSVPALLSRRLSCLVPHASVLESLDRQALLFLCKSVLAEREHSTPPAELVWTGPEGSKAAARSTEVVFRDLLRSARSSVWMAGYAVDHGADLFAPLHQVMAEHGVQATFLVNLEGHVKHTADIHGEARFRINEFISENWPFGAPLPSFYYDPRTLDSKVFASMHAKTLVVDELHVLIGSANFTNRGQTRNIEAGALLHDRGFAKALVTQFQSLIDAQHIRSYDDNSESSA
jgi:phosphatidylserine/phosphatidylglycerophosphate/cardiolipin synthase-like enzyme